MFYVGNTLWLEGKEWFSDIPNFPNFSGCIRYSNGIKFWYDKGKLHSFQNPKTQEWMPAYIYPDGTKVWYDKGEVIYNPESYFKDRGRIKE